MSKVLYIPELAMNLLFHKFCSYGHRVVFSKDVCNVFGQTFSGGQVVVIGDQHNELYRLRQNIINISYTAAPKEDIWL